ncbi:hypothetical protein [Paenibacillus sp. N3.4]|uniref:hypothetical protein n=1 Tax=Paenibacillus sp. N3.4 TaxID=2603222 RepID=UPI0011C99478|nr:hypothetical protein [Paenibacillus sp. N3.4]TXK84198.1 hypothetical protein FU659_10115 [Paenibacillus sp. N3.4]
MKSIVQRIVILILFLLTIIACSNEQKHISTTSTTGHFDPQQAQAVYRPDLFPEQVMIPYVESLGQPLEYGSPPAAANFVRSFTFPQSQAEIRVYSNPDSPSSMMAYLKGEKSEWRLGYLSGVDGGQDASWIYPLKFVTGEVSGASIEVPFGSVGSQNGLLVYYKHTDSWKVVDFQGHRAISIDIDDDGVPEWVGNQTDWVPPAVEIHRWVPESDRFEFTVIQMDSSLFPNADNNTPSYSSLFMEEGKYFIEIGNDAYYTFFTYDQGALKKYRPADTRDRIYEMQMARRH